MRSSSLSLILLHSALGNVDARKNQVHGTAKATIVAHRAGPIIDAAAKGHRLL
jgi:hypothetical protein